MDDPRLQAERSGPGLRYRLDQVAEKANSVLMVLAIGLALLDFTCFCAFQAQQALPSAARADAGPLTLSQVAKATPQIASTTPQIANATQVSPTALATTMGPR